MMRMVKWGWIEAMKNRWIINDAIANVTNTDITWNNGMYSSKDGIIGSNDNDDYDFFLMYFTRIGIDLFCYRSFL